MPTISDEGIVETIDIGTAQAPRAGEQIAKTVIQSYDTLSSADLTDLTIGNAGSPFIVLQRVIGGSTVGSWQWAIDGSNNLTLDRIVGTGAYVWNELGASVDFRMEGDTDAELFFLDGSANRIGLSKTDPAVLFDVGGAANFDGAVTLGADLTVTDQVTIGGSIEAGSIFNIEPGVAARDILTSVGTGLHIEADTQAINAAGNGETVAIGALAFLGIPTWTSVGTTFTVTDAATLYIQGAPVDSDNVTAGDSFSLWVDDGPVKFDSTLTVGIITTVGDLSLDGDLDFVGPQAITTTTGDLTLNPAGDVACGSNAFTGMGALTATTGAFSGLVTIDDTDEWLLLTDTASSGSVDLTFQNGTTGTGAAGFQVGITASEKAILLNYENTDMLFHTNNTLAATLAPGGNFTVVGAVTATAGTFSGALVVSGALGADQTSAATMDFSSGTSRYVSYGANASTAGVTNITNASSNFSVSHTISFTGADVTLPGDLVVSGTGPHAIGGAAVDYRALSLLGAFTSLGASDVAGALFCGVGLTGAGGDTARLSQVHIAGTIATQTATESIGSISTLRVSEPAITDNLTGDITVAATVHIIGAPDEGLSNYALWSDDGVNRFDGLITGKGGTIGIDIDAAGMVSINDTTNANMTIGLTINQGGADNQILAFKSSDVDTGLTTAPTATSVEIDDFVTFQKSSATAGGLQLQVMSVDTAVTPVFRIETYGGTATTTKTEAGRSLFEITAAEHNGSNTLANITEDGNVFGVRGRVGGSARALFMVDEDGDLFADGGTTTAAVTVFDEHDDAQLVRAFDLARAPDQVIRSAWDENLRHNEQALVDCGVLGDTIANGGLVCITQLQRLHNGAIWQAYCERQELCERIEKLEQLLLPAA